ncbi:hypothetical protein HGRIS_012467 [Hohenbuehelia grisea]|uniref:Protein artemis n=1 Tax=Hohenbuehelia grisea TaxID=104357 RepID=A0ABR3ISE7_9AGAR
MPTGTPFQSIVRPYNIRVDDFSPNVSEQLKPSLHLLTHTHSDHINGLSAKSFSWPVICSSDAKEMLLRHEVFAERALFDTEFRAEKIKTFSHLRVEPVMHPDGSVYYNGSRDLLRPISLNTPTRYQLSEHETVTITALNANHCPGAIMFLLEGSKGAVLHTGDFRAEPWFLEALMRDPILQPYIAIPGVPRQHSKASKVVKTLEAIYLDTACLLSPNDVPTKQQATSGLIELLQIYPPSTCFFINSWTWGYEDILKDIARAFDCQIHVDRYKYSVYTRLSDPLLREIVTREETTTRFHACERFERCEQVDVEEIPFGGRRYHNCISKTGNRVVYVNPVTMSSENWALYLADTKAKLVAGQEINHLLVPLSRHSPLPELQSFVKLFRPHRVVPNTLSPELQNLDWIAMSAMFADCLSGGHDVDAAAAPSELIQLGGGNGIDEGDIALKNLVGDGAAEFAERWAESGKIRRKLEFLRPFLPSKERSLVNQCLGIDEPVTPSRIEEGVPATNTLWKGKAKAAIEDSDQDTDFAESDDERGRTAHKLFAAQAGLDDKENQWWHSSSPAQSQIFSDQPEAVLQAVGLRQTPMQLLSPNSSPLRKRGLRTPISSPIRQAKDKRPRDEQTRRVPLSPTSRLQSWPEPADGPSVLSTSRIDVHASNPIASTSRVTLSAVLPADETLTRVPKQLVPALKPPFRLASRVKQPSSTRAKGKEREREVIYITSSSPCPPDPHPRSTTQKRGTFNDMSSGGMTSKVISSSNHAKRPTSLGSQGSGSSVDTVRPSKRRKGHHSPTNPVELRPIPKPTLHNQDKLPSVTNIPSQSELRSTKLVPAATSSTSISPRRVAKRMRKTERHAVADRLAKARPDLMAPTYHAKLERRTAKLCREETREQYREGMRSFGNITEEVKASSFETVHSDGDASVDWERSHALAEELRQKVAKGERIQLPRLICAESQDFSDE